MTDFRSNDQIERDFRAISPEFRAVQDRWDLFGLITGNPEEDSNQTVAGLGSQSFHLGPMEDPNNQEWVGVGGVGGVRAFLGSRLVSPTARQELQGLEHDLRTADANHDRYLNNDEIVRFVQAPRSGWNNVSTFRIAAENYLNRLPAYISQPNPNEQQTRRLWEIMNLYATQSREAGTPSANLGAIYGLSLDEYPARLTPPDLILRAMTGNLEPQELASIHHLLTIPTNNQGNLVINQGSSSPLLPWEVGMLEQVLRHPDHNAGPFAGMTILSQQGDQNFLRGQNETVRRFRLQMNVAQGGLNVSPPAGGWREGDRITINGMTITPPTSSAPAPRGPLCSEDAVTVTSSSVEALRNQPMMIPPRLLNGDRPNRVAVTRNGWQVQTITHTVRRNEPEIDRVLQNAVPALDRFEAANSHRISPSILIARAYYGLLNPAENTALRNWMRSEAPRLGIVSNGPLSDFTDSFLGTFRGIVAHPGHFLARNGAFLVWDYLWDRLVFQRMLGSRLTQLCGGPTNIPYGSPSNRAGDTGRGLIERLLPARALRRRFQQWIARRFGANYSPYANLGRLHGLYRRFLSDQALGRGLLRSLPRRGLDNWMVHLGMFNLLAMAKDGSISAALGCQANGSLEILTDAILPPILGLHLFFDLRRRASLQAFIGQNPSICRGAPATAPALAMQTATQQAPSTAAESAAAPMSPAGIGVVDPAFDRPSATVTIPAPEPEPAQVQSPSPDDLIRRMNHGQPTILILPLPALGLGALLEGLFGTGAAAGAVETTAPAWGGAAYAGGVL